MKTNKLSLFGVAGVLILALLRAPAARAASCEASELACLGGPGGDCYRVMDEACADRNGYKSPITGHYQVNCRAVGPSASRNPLEFQACCECVEKESADSSGP